MNLDFNRNFEQCKKFFINPYMQDKAKPFGGLAELKKKDRKEKIKASLAMAYSTAQRTFGGISKIEKNKGDIFINLAAKINKEFCSAKAWESFRDKLNSWRNELITQFQQSYTMTVGQAQKIINMTFKFLYCLEDKPNEDDYKYCHMPLDSYTLAWFRKILGNSKLDNFNCNTKWSNIDDDSLYNTIQDRIHKYLSEQPVPKLYGKINLDESSFKSEFVIWYYMQGEELVRTMIKDLSKTPVDFEIYKNVLGNQIDLLKKISKLL